jgi:hypothetical protein
VNVNVNVNKIENTFPTDCLMIAHHSWLLPTLLRLCWLPTRRKLTHPDSNSHKMSARRSLMNTTTACVSRVIPDLMTRPTSRVTLVYPADSRWCVPHVSTTTTRMAMSAVDMVHSQMHPQSWQHINANDEWYFNRLYIRGAGIAPATFFMILFFLESFE